MKRFFIILLAFVAFAVNAQDKVLGRYDYFLAWGDVDEALSGTTAEYKTILVQKDHRYYYDAYVNLDSAGDGTNFTIVLQGSIDGTNWTNITSVTWAVSSSDTTIRYHNLTETNSWAYGARTDVFKGTHTTATATDYINGKIDGTDSLGASGVGDYTVDDTLTIAQRVLTRTDTLTLGTQTVTETLTEGTVMWRMLRWSFTGAGAGAGATIDYINLGIARKD